MKPKSSIYRASVLIAVLTVFLDLKLNTANAEGTTKDSKAKSDALPKLTVTAVPSSSATDKPKTKTAIPNSAEIWKTLVTYSPEMKKAPKDVENLMDRDVKIGGYVIPNDIENVNELKDFMLTPVAGGCAHVPPPPPNYVVHVIMADGKKIKVPFAPVEVVGRLSKPKKNEDREFFSYELVATSVEDYETAKRRESKK